MKSPGGPPSLSCSVVGLVVWIGAREQRSWLQLILFPSTKSHCSLFLCMTAVCRGPGVLGTTLKVSRKNEMVLQWFCQVLQNDAISFPKWLFLPLWGQVNFVVWKMCSVNAAKSSCKPPKASEFLDRKAITCRFLSTYRKLYFWVYST